MKKIIFLVLIIALSFHSCSQKKESSVPDLSNVKAEPSSAPAENAAPNSQPELKKEGNTNLPGYALINGSDCLSCHKTDQNLIGPSYEEVANKYSEKDVDVLADKIVNGGSGVWGSVPMAAHPNISHNDAKKMVEYILTLKK